MVVGGVCRPDRSYSLVVLDHQVEGLLAVGGHAVHAGLRKAAEELASPLGGALVISSGPAGGDLRGAGEVAIDARAEPVLEVVLQHVSPDSEPLEELFVGQIRRPAPVGDRAVDGDDDLFEALAFGDEVIAVTPERRQLVGVAIEDLSDLR